MTARSSSSPTLTMMYAPIIGMLFGLGLLALGGLTSLPASAAGPYDGVYEGTATWKTGACPASVDRIVAQMRLVIDGDRVTSILTMRSQIRMQDIVVNSEGSVSERGSLQMKGYVKPSPGRMTTSGQIAGNVIDGTIAYRAFRYRCAAVFSVDKMG